MSKTKLPTIICDQCFKEALVEAIDHTTYHVKCHDEQQIVVYLASGEHENTKLVWSNIKQKFVTDSALRNTVYNAFSRIHTASIELVRSDLVRESHVGECVQFDATQREALDTTIDALITMRDRQKPLPEPVRSVPIPSQPEACPRCKTTPPTKKCAKHECIMKEL